MTDHPRLTHHLRMALPHIPARTKRADVLARREDHLVDEMIASYVDWREDAASAADAYADWREARRAEAAWRFAVYMAALEREESAARGFAASVANLQRWSPGLPSAFVTRPATP